jgi:hypothetical protein
MGVTLDCGLNVGRLKVGDDVLVFAYTRPIAAKKDGKVYVVHDVQRRTPNTVRYASLFLDSMKTRWEKAEEITEAGLISLFFNV